MKQFNKVRTTLTLDPDVYEVISTLAEKDDRSVSSMINKILREYVKDMSAEKEGE